MSSRFAQLVRVVRRVRQQTADYESSTDSIPVSRSANCGRLLWALIRERVCMASRTRRHEAVPALASVTFQGSREATQAIQRRTLGVACAQQVAPHVPAYAALGSPPRINGGCTRRQRMDTGPTWDDWSIRFFAGSRICSLTLHRVVAAPQLPQPCSRSSRSRSSRRRSSRRRFPVRFTSRYTLAPRKRAAA